MSKRKGVNIDALETRRVIQSAIERCARCRSNHPELHFKRFPIPVGDWTHWTLCPKLNEPILMQIVGTDSQTIIIS
jgi:hypothetical protein